MDAANGGAVAGWIRGSIVFEELGDLMAESGLEERDTRGVEGGGGNASIIEVSTIFKVSVEALPVAVGYLRQYIII